MIEDVLIAIGIYIVYMNIFLAIFLSHVREIVIVNILFYSIK